MSLAIDGFMAFGMLERLIDELVRGLEMETQARNVSSLQKGLLPCCAAAQLVNDADLDWLHIAEAIGALRRSECSSLRSKITAVTEHPMRLFCRPETG